MNIPGRWVISRIILGGMSNKYAEKKEWKVPKHKYKLSNWSEYSDALRRRGEIDVWLSEEANIIVIWKG